MKIKLLIIMLLLGGCISKVEQIIEVGMEFKKAEKIVTGSGAQEAQLQLRPEKSLSGGYMQLNVYALSKKTYIIINHEEENGKNRIKTMSLYSIQPDSKKNSQGRTMRNVDKIDLNEIEKTE
jgi:hypothetical protein